MCTVLSSLFSNNKTKSLFTPWKFGSIAKSKYRFGTYIDTFDWYFFQLIVLLEPNFNCRNTFVLSWVHKVTIGKFCLSYCKYCFLICSSIRCYNKFFRPRLLSQLTPKIFDSTIISIFFVLLAFVIPIIFSLYSNELLLWLAPVKSTMASIPGLINKDRSSL